LNKYLVEPKGDNEKMNEKRTETTTIQTLTNNAEKSQIIESEEQTNPQERIQQSEAPTTTIPNNANVVVNATNPTSIATTTTIQHSHSIATTLDSSDPINMDIYFVATDSESHFST
jgi:hypothetical protein